MAALAADAAEDAPGGDDLGAALADARHVLVLIPVHVDLVDGTLTVDLRVEQVREHRGRVVTPDDEVLHVVDAEPELSASSATARF